MGLDEDVHVITSKLIIGHTTPSLVAITREKGIGKTTMARKIYRNPEVAHHFPCQAWVTLPLDFEPNTSLFNIAKQVLVGFVVNDSIEKIKYKLSRLWWFQSKIPVRRLIVLWVAEGLVDQPPDSAETPEFAGEKILNELVQKFIIQVAKWKPTEKLKHIG
ncbi:hypothetical protein POM88_035074 [Heracleum sosnowskyi]|uniref:NB-ARC domain-containing protein n=1 Tax=Heracleum sosnowskyi TaxID=360622 RepID=A0AAD8HMM9_9APIA|nr:hypothetical protein POM88_035074 [Heracleum sosnowskyi]